MSSTETKLTDLNKAIADGPDYWLGPVVKVYRIAEYAFVEYEYTDFHSGPNYGKRDGSHRFSCFINERNTGRGWGQTLDENLVGVIGYKRDGCNSQAADLFLKATAPESGNGCHPEIQRIFYQPEGQ